MNPTEESAQICSTDSTSGDKVVDEERRRVAVFGGELFAVRRGVGEGDFFLREEAAVHEAAPDGVQHAGGDALSSRQTEHPDPADPTQSLFRDGGAAPGSVSLHEVVLHHVFVLLWLLQDSESLTDGFSHQTAHHRTLCVDKEVSLGLCGSAQGHLLETQLTVRYSPHILSLFDGVFGIIWHHEEDFSIPELSHHPLFLPAHKFDGVQDALVELVVLEVVLWVVCAVHHPTGAAGRGPELFLSRINNELVVILFLLPPSRWALFN